MRPFCPAVRRPFPEKSEAIVAVPELLRLLSDNESIVRASAAEALGEIGALDALPDLEHALEIEDEAFAIEYIQAAIDKLTEIKNETTPHVVSEPISPDR